MYDLVHFREAIVKFMAETYSHLTQNAKGELIFGGKSGSTQYSKFLAAQSITANKWRKMRASMIQLGMDEELLDGPATQQIYSVHGQVSAGPMAAAEGIEEASRDRLDIRATLSPSLVCLQVSGHSCTGFGILDGDYVFVRRGHFLDQGQILVFQGPDNTYTLKAYHRKKLYGFVDGKLKVVGSDANLTVFGMVEWVLGNRKHNRKQGEPRWLANLGG